MEFKVRNEGNIVVFELLGNVDFESAIQFRQGCQETIQKQNPQRMVFNLSGLRFVGSSAITQFIKVLKEYNRKAGKPKYCHLSMEFERMFRAFETARKPFEIYPSESEALLSFDIPEAPRRRGRRPIG